MAEIVGSRLEELLIKRGMSQSELAKRVGIKQPSIGRLISGETRSSGYLLEIARHLQVSPDFLTGETDDPTAGALPAPTAETVAEQLDSVMVAEIDLGLGMGASYSDGPVRETLIPFPKSWLRQFSYTHESNLRFARGMGDSMQPTIADQDIVLFDMSQQSINRQDHIWVAAIGDVVMIKRVRALPDGTYELHSDNDRITPQPVADGEMHVIGRVVAVLKRL